MENDRRMTEKQKLPVLVPERVAFVKKIESKKCVFDALTNLLEKGQKEVTKNQIFDALVSREKLGDTYIGSGIALPRAHLALTNPRAALLIVKKGLHLNSADKKDIKLFLAVLVPEKQQKEYSDRLSDYYKNLLKDKELDFMIKSENTELIAQYFDKFFNFEDI